MGLVNRKDQASRPRGFPADNVISLDNGRHAHARIAVLDARLDAQNFSQSAHQHFRAAGYFRRQGQDQVQPRACLWILIHYKIKTSGGNIAGLALL